MTTEPVVDPESGIPHRRRRSTWWTSTPNGVKILVAACLVLVAAGSLALSGRWFQGPPPSAVPAPPSAGEAFDAISAKAVPIDLVLSRSALNPATRRIEGVVLNQSDHSYTDVQVSFYYLPSASLSEMESATVTIPNLGPHHDSMFATHPLDSRVKRWWLREIKGKSDAPNPVAASPAKDIPPVPSR